MGTFLAMRSGMSVWLPTQIQAVQCDTAGFTHLRAILKGKRLNVPVFILR